MTNGRHIFVDTNILTRATIDAAPLHKEARTVLDELWQEGAQLYISHQVIREYIANATRPQTYSPPLELAVVLGQVEDFRKSFYILPDSPTVLLKLLDLLRQTTVGGKQIHDANVVATMLANNIDELLTHNIIDFERYAAHIKVLPLVKNKP